MSLFLAMTAFALGGDLSKKDFKATPLADSIYMLEGAGGNSTALIGPEGTLLVDDDYAPMASKLLAKLKELGGDSPRYIVNTHFHYDHTGGNEFFGNKATIIAAVTVRERLSEARVVWNEKIPALPHHARPALTFERSLELHLNGENARIVHFPKAHTEGDTVVFFLKSKVASLGDLYFSGMYPHLDPEHDGSLEGYLKALELVWKQVPVDAKIIPGHGPLSSRAELRQYIDMIRASRAIVRKSIKSGRTLKQIQKAGLPREWEPFSHGYLSTDEWLALVYADVKK